MRHTPYVPTKSRLDEVDTERFGTRVRRKLMMRTESRHHREASGAYARFPGDPIYVTRRRAFSRFRN